MPLSSLYGPPIATIVPSLDKETEYPLKSNDASPSISLPNCVHNELEYWKTLTCPESAPLPSLPLAPIATIVPSLDKETEYPLKSNDASPSISLPNCVHKEVLLLYSKTLTYPESAPLSSLPKALIATIEPSLDKET